MSDSPTVFVVDDDPAIGRAISAGISQLMSFPVRVFPSAEEFLSAYEPDQSGCLVLDVRLPGVNGLELQEKMLADGVTLPIIMVSGHGGWPQQSRRSNPAPSLFWRSRSIFNSSRCRSESRSRRMCRREPNYSYEPGCESGWLV